MGKVRNNRLFLSNVRRILEANDKGEFRTNGSYLGQYYFFLTKTYNAGGMFPERVKYLERIGFFDRVDPASRLKEDRDQKFRDQVQGLRDYLILHNFEYPPTSLNSCADTLFCTRKEQQKVAGFINSCRSRLYNLSSPCLRANYHILNKHRVDLLNEMNFVWNPVEDQPWAYINNGRTKVAEVVSEF